MVIMRARNVPVIEEVNDAGEIVVPAELVRATLSLAHQFAGYPSPTHAILVRSVPASIRRAKGTAQNWETADPHRRLAPSGVVSPEQA